MAKSKKKTAAKRAKRVAKGAATLYGARVYMVGASAKREAQYKTVTSDARKVGRAANKVAGKAGRTRAGVGAAMLGERGARKAKSSTKRATFKVKHQASEGKFGYKTARRGEPTGSLLYKSARAGAKTGKTVNAAGRNKKKVGAGIVLGAAGTGAAVYAYKRRQAKKTATSPTYKRRTKSGKTITVRKGRRR